MAPFDPREYLAQAAGPGRIGGDDPIAPTQLPFDYMLNALRLVEGFRLGDFESRTGLDRDAIRTELQHAMLMGWLRQTGEHIVPTELGRRFTNDVISLFLHD